MSQILNIDDLPAFGVFKTFITVEKHSEAQTEIEWNTLTTQLDIRLSLCCPVTITKFGRQ